MTGLVLDEEPSAVPLAQEDEVVAVSADFVAPAVWQSPSWGPFFGFEDWWDSDLSALSATPSDVVDGAAVRDRAVAALVSVLRNGRSADGGWSAGPFPNQWDGYAGRCRRIDVLGAHAAMLPLPARFARTVAKTVVVWTGDCVDGLTDAALGDAEVTLTETSVQVSYVYVEKRNGRWSPVRESALPGSASGEFRTGAVPAQEELVEFRPCTAVPVVVHVDLVAALEQMCADAANDGVALRYVSGYRNAAEQRQRYVDATRFYDDSSVAAQKVAWDTSGRCASRHCVGEAVDVTGNGAAAWLGEVMRCSGGGQMSADGCPSGEVPVLRAQLYGFAVPFSWQAGHLEWALPPFEQQWFTSCDPSPALAVQQQVAAVWRCRLAEAGLSREEVREAVAGALVVSRCVSGWNSSFLAASGRFVNSPDPASGQLRTEAGLFGLPRQVADRLVTGGWDAATDPVANATAAAELFLESVTVGRDGFSFWACAPQGELPAWAYRW